MSQLESEKAVGTSRFTYDDMELLEEMNRALRFMRRSRYLVCNEWKISKDVWHGFSYNKPIEVKVKYPEKRRK